MSSVRAHLHVVLVADDPIEAGMLALDLVQAGVAAQAVRDDDAVATQMAEMARTRPQTVLCVVAAHRELGQTLELAHLVSKTSPSAGFVAVVLRSQRDAAERVAREQGWSGVACRPVNAEELVGLVTTAAARSRPPSEATGRTGLLQEEPLHDLLGQLVDRIPRPGSGKNATVRMESRGRHGVVAVVDGELVHAEVDGEVGRHALERLACWRHGSFQVDPDKQDLPTTLHGSTLGLLAVAQEYSRRVEEARQNLPYADCVCTVRWERVRPLPVVAEALFRRIATGLVLADAIPGEGDDELEAFAALEARIKRGAVVPQIETAPRLQDTTTPPPGLAERVPSHAGRTTSTVQSGVRTTSITSGARPPSQFSAVPMTLVDAPQMPERRRSHPTTHLYRVGDQIRVTPPPVDPDNLPPDLPGGSAEADGDQPPSLPTSSSVRRTPSQAVLPASAQTPGARKGMVTGWFGVAVGGEDEAGLAQDSLPPPAPSHRREPSRLMPGPGAAARMSQGLPVNSAVTRPVGEEARLAARPYAWVPAQPQGPGPNDADGDDDADEAPRKKPRPRWPWAVAASVLSLAVLVAIVWPSPPPAPAVPQLSASARAYKKAVGLIDAGQEGEAITTLRELIRSTEASPEALLQLGVLEARAGQFEAARQHLDTYLAHPQARHAGRARRLYQHVFGSAAFDGQAPGATSPVGGSGGTPQNTVQTGT